MFVLNLACLFQTPGSLSNAVILSSCYIKHMEDGRRCVQMAFKAYMSKIVMFTVSLLTQKQIQAPEFVYDIVLHVLRLRPGNLRIIHIKGPTLQFHLKFTQNSFSVVLKNRFIFFLNAGNYLYVDPKKVPGMI